MTSRPFVFAWLALVAWALQPAPADAAIQSVPLQVGAGKERVVVRGTLRGRDIMDYRLTAGSGQRLSVALTASHPSTYFNVLPPLSDGQAIYNSSVDGNSWVGVLQTSGEFTVRVYLYRNEARRGTETRYRLTVGLTGTPGSQDAWVPGTPFHATGVVRCALGNQPMADCRFGVIRQPPGRAELHLTQPSGLGRLLQFDGDRVTAPDQQAVRAWREGDDWVVEVNDYERYRIPDAVINGG